MLSPVLCSHTERFEWELLHARIEADGKIYPWLTNFDEEVKRTKQLVSAQPA